MDPLTLTIDDAPCELACSIREFWPQAEWNNAARIAYLESGFDPFAIHDSTTTLAPCGSPIGFGPDGTEISAEVSIGYFQINACNFPDWPEERFYNGRHNAGTAHALWDVRGWSPWFFSARTLGLV